MRDDTLTEMVAPSRDFATLNAIVNAADVRPGVGPGDHVIDLTPLGEVPNNLFFLGDHGGFALIWTAPRTYEVHTFIRSEGRGAWARMAAFSMVRQMRDIGVSRLWTQIAKGSDNVARYAKDAGMRETGEELATFGHPHLVYEMGL